MTREQELCLEMQLRKRKKTHDPTLLATSEQFDVAMPSARSPRDHDIYDKVEGTHERVHDKSKCGRCRWNGHIFQECTMDVELCHHFHQPSHIKANCLRLVVGAAQVLLKVLLQEGGAEP